MINELLLWFMLIPISIALTIFYFTRRQFARQGIGAVIVPPLTYLGVALLILMVSFYGSSAVATADTELWNGQVTGKSRDHDTYEQSYSCNCTTDSKGNTSCQTCYETHYTVKWWASSTIGNFTIDSADSTSRRVYNTPDPSFYTSIRIGDPAAKTHTYTNYVQAVPQSLFATPPAELRKRFASLLPKYPDQIYNYYSVDRFLTPGYSSPDAPLWNRDIGLMLRELGPRKQVNAIVVIAKTADPEYEYALRDHWEGVNKNDVVLLIGSAEWPRIDFVRVISWTKNELFKIELRDNVQALNTIQREPIMSLLAAQISKNFERRRMREFAYLKNEIDPPAWLLITDAVILILGGALLIAWLLDKLPFGRRPVRRFR